jgi:hypothetical protein
MVCASGGGDNDGIGAGLMLERSYAQGVDETMSKRLLTVVLGLVVTFSSVQAVAGAEPKHGDVIGQVLSTDIQAYINEHPVPSLNVDGYTAVVAEDLREYGFDVAWIPQEKRVVIRYREGKPIRPLTILQTEQVVGSKLADVLHTDIKTYYGDTSIRSYNIGGKTAILLNDLDHFGRVEWSEEERSIAFYPETDRTGDDEHPRLSPLVIRQPGEITIEGIAIGDETVTYENVEIGRIVDGMPLISVEWLAERLHYNVVEEPGGVLYVNNGTYGFRLYAGERKIARYWFGSPAGDFEIFMPAVKLKGEWLVYETDLRSLFSYFSVWNPETRLLDIEYRNYVVEDYGLSDRVDNYNYVVYTDSYVSGYGGWMPNVYVSNRINGENRIYGVSSGSSTGGGGSSESGPNYVTAGETRLDIGRNELEVVASEQLRLIFYRKFVVELNMDQVKPIIEYNGPTRFGDYTILQSVSPDQAYITSKDSKLTISGQAERTIGSEMTLLIEKMDGDRRTKVSETKVPFDEMQFNAMLQLPEEAGLYRVTAISVVTYPRGTSSTEVVKWYVNKVAP